MADVAVRSARIAEADAVLACYEWLFAPPGSQPASWNPDWAKVALVDAIDSDAANVLVADEGGRISGFCTAYLDLLSVRYGLRCWVEDLAVNPEHRSAGVGKALLDAAKDWGRERGASHLELDSGEARTDAHRFYDREQPSWRSINFGWEL